MDRFAEQYFGDDRPIVGGVIGIVDGDAVLIRGYGRVTLDQPANEENKPTSDTIYEIASVSKTFTGVLLGEMSSRGEVAIDDPLEKYFPENVSIPSFEGQKITLKHLSSHCSSIPRLPTNFWDIADKTPENPYLHYTTEEIYEFLDGYELKDAPGTRYEYSNLAASMLGHALERCAGKTYEQLVQERICTPLGMQNTVLVLTPETQKNLAPPYNEKKERVSNWDLPGFAGGGGLRSSMRDMIKFAQAAAGCFDAFPELAADSNHPLIAGIKLSEQPYFTDAKQSQTVGLGWHIREDGNLTHNGQTGGYHSEIIVSPTKKRAVVILTNTAVDESGKLAKEIWRMLDETTPPQSTAAFQYK